MRDLIYALESDLIAILAALTFYLNCWAIYLISEP